MDVSQSAPSAAGVVPPITQWKKRGPEERTCASSPPSISWSSAASVPNPSSGRGPPKASAASLERASRTGAVGSDARYASASRATRSSAARLSAGCSSGSDTLPNLQCRAMQTAIPIAAGASAACALAWGHFEAGWVRLEELDCPLERLPPELAGVRIAHLSDFHLGFPSRGEQAVLSAVDWVSSRKPDLVFVSGDLLSRRQGEPLLRELLARLPNCYAVLGNHDFAETKDPFASRSPVGDLEPATLLLDEARTVEVRGRRVQIVGVDPRSYRRGLAQPERLADPEADLRILLCHFPNVIDRLPKGVFDLVVSGHLHAGQITLPLPGRRIPLAHPRWRYFHGLYRHHGGTLHVSAGLGTTFVPFRFLARPEATELVLVQSHRVDGD